jgi:hypothetical protein
MKEIITIEKVREHFRTNYGHINLYSITDRTIVNFLTQNHIINLPFNRQMDCLYDYVVSQDMCDVEE